MHPLTRRRTTADDTGSIAWALLISIAIALLVSVFTASVIQTVQRSKASTDATVLTQYTDTATADAIALLNAGETLPRTLQESIDGDNQTCEKVGPRTLCWRTWAMPVPGTAVDPVRYDLVSRTWLDEDGDELEPADGMNVRSTKVALEVITYQTGPGLGPVLQDGYVAYHPTPAGLFANALHSFTSSNLEGPDLRVRSYNSATGDTGTGSAAVSTSGWVSYGDVTQTDQTILFGGAAPGGDQPSRCTGEACEESDVRVVDATYAHPTEASTAWMRTVGAATCDQVVDGDWIVSEHGFKLPAGETCVNGSLIVDATATTTTPLTTVFVNGLVVVNGSLNAPGAGILAQPSSLVIYSTGAAVSFTPPADSAISAMIYAPTATCGTNPGSTAKITYFGSLVCDVISIGGPWDHLYDEAATAEYVDPVPGAEKTYSPGVPSAVDFDDFLVPSGWTANSCVYAPPTGSTGYWKLDEPSGPLARDSAGNVGAAGWAGANVRTDGVCAKAATATGGGTIVGTQPVTSTTGVTLEYWAKGLTGTAVQIGGVRVAHDSSAHVSVTVGTTTVKVPFTVQNHAQWHHYTVTVSTSGAVTLYVDGISKGTGSTGVAPASTSGALTAAGGATGAIDEVVYYPKALTAAEVATRFTWWTSPLKISSSVSLTAAGTPFTAPTGFADNGTIPTALKIRWVAPTGTFPTGSSSYAVQQADASSGPWGSAGTGSTAIAGTATAWQLANPAPGSRWYRVCATYNGDTRCSTAVQITTVTVPAAPVVTVSATTTTTATFTWTTPTYTDSFEYQWRVNGGQWNGNGAPDPAVYTRPLASPSVGLGPTTQGDRLEVRVRAVNAAGTGPWSDVGTANLGIDLPRANGWETTSSYPTVGARLVVSTGTMCPSGTIPQAKMRDQHTTWGTTWNPYGAWSSGSAESYAGPWMYSGVAAYDYGANQRQTLRCYNPNSGNSSAEWGEHGPISLYHPLPAPSGIWIGLTAWHRVDWSATCPAGTSTYMWWSVYTTAWGWASGEGYMSSGYYYRGESNGWGNGAGRLNVRADCRARGLDGPDATMTNGY